RNAFNFDAGSTSLTNNTIASAQQFLTITAGANLNEQAQRAETVTFTLSLKEMKTWRKRLQRSERQRRLVGDPMCDPTGRELRGHLGLAEWIDSALYPVERAELQAGIHPQPASGPSKPPSPNPGGPKALGLIKVPVKEAKPKIDAAAQAAADD